MRKQYYANQSAQVSHGPGKAWHLTSLKKLVSLISLVVLPQLMLKPSRCEAKAADRWKLRPLKKKKNTSTYLHEAQGHCQTTNFACRETSASCWLSLTVSCLQCPRRQSQQATSLHSADQSVIAPGDNWKGCGAHLMFSQALLRRVVAPRRYIMIVLPIGVCALHSHFKDGAFHSHFTHTS